MGSIKKRTLKDGKTVYDCRVHRGKETRSQTFQKKEDAEKWARSIEGKVDRGENISKKAQTTMFTVACAEYIAHYKPLKTKDKVLTPGEIQTVQRLNQDFKPFTISEINHKPRLSISRT